MKLTPLLVGLLYRRLKRDPGASPDIQILSPYMPMTWEVADEVLTLTALPNGAAPQVETYNLTQFNLVELTLQIQADFVYEGWTIQQFPAASRQAVGAIVLIDGSGTFPAGVGTLYGYTRLSWAFLDTAARELTTARAAVEAAPGELALNTADGNWLDLQGTYYGISRLPSETDAAYSSRIVFQTLLPRGNNVSIALAIQRYLGLTVTVDDVVSFTPSEPMFDGRPTFNGAYDYDPAVVPIYGLFDINVATKSITAAQIASITQVTEMLLGSGNGLRNVNAAG